MVKIDFDAALKEIYNEENLGGLSYSSKGLEAWLPESGIRWFGRGWWPEDAPPCDTNYQWCGKWIHRHPETNRVLSVQGHLFIDVKHSCGDWASWVAKTRRIHDKPLTIYWAPNAISMNNGAWYARKNDMFWAPNLETATWIHTTVLGRPHTEKPKKATSTKVAKITKLWEGHTCDQMPAFPNSYEDIVKAALVAMPMRHERGLWTSATCVEIIKDWSKVDICDFSRLYEYAEFREMQKKGEKIMEVDF